MSTIPSEHHNGYYAAVLFYYKVVNTGYSFRHSAATNLIHNGVDIAAVSNILGHNTPNVTLGIYAHEVKEATVYGCNMMSQLLAKHRV